MNVVLVVCFAHCLNVGDNWCLPREWNGFVWLDGWCYDVTLSSRTLTTTTTSRTPRPFSLGLACPTKTTMRFTQLNSLDGRHTSKCSRTQPFAKKWMLVRSLFVARERMNAQRLIECHQATQALESLRHRENRCVMLALLRHHSRTFSVRVVVHHSKW